MTFWIQFSVKKALSSTNRSFDHPERADWAAPSSVRRSRPPVPLRAGAVRAVPRTAPRSRCVSTATARTCCVTRAGPAGAARREADPGCHHAENSRFCGSRVARVRRSGAATCGRTRHRVAKSSPRPPGADATARAPTVRTITAAGIRNSSPAATFCPAGPPGPGPAATATERTCPALGRAAAGYGRAGVHSPVETGPGWGGPCRAGGPSALPSAVWRPTRSGVSRGTGGYMAVSGAD